MQDYNVHNVPCYLSCSQTPLLSRINKININSRSKIETRGRESQRKLLSQNFQEYHGLTLKMTKFITKSILTKLGGFPKSALCPLFQSAPHKLVFWIILRMRWENVDTSTFLHHVLVSAQLVTAGLDNSFMLGCCTAPHEAQASLLYNLKSGFKFWRLIITNL